MRWGEILPKLDPRSFPIYLTLAVLSAITYLALHLTGLSLGPRWSWFVPMASAALIFCATMLRRAGRDRTSAFLETTALMYGQGMAVTILQFPMIALGAPFADKALLTMDQAMGFDWWAFYHWTEPAHSVLEFAYNSMTWQAGLVLLLLCFFNEIDRAWKLVTASLIALVITIAIFPFVPADGSYVGCGAHCDWIGIIHDVRAGELTVIERQLGMVSFPSFHTAASILLAWGFWAMKPLRIPAVILNGLMIAGTIVIGSHYLIDVIGGSLVAVLAMGCCRFLFRQQSTSDSQGSLPSYSLSRRPRTES